MNIASNNDPHIVAVTVLDDVITAELSDGRTISVPLVVAIVQRDSRAAQQI